MRTIKELKAELDKFPDDCVCYAYEGESTGIIVEYPNERRPGHWGDQGIIWCEDRGDDPQLETKLLPPRPDQSLSILSTFP